MQIKLLEAAQLVNEVVTFFEEIGVELRKAGNLPLDDTDFASLMDLFLEKDGKVWNSHTQEWYELEEKRPGILYIGHHTEHNHEEWAEAFRKAAEKFSGKTYTETDYEDEPEGEEEAVSLPGVYVRVNRIRYTYLGEVRTGVIIDHELDNNGKIVVLPEDMSCFNRVAPESVIEQWVDGSYVNLGETAEATLVR